MNKALAFAAAMLLSASALAEVQVEGAYARAMPPGQANSAAFMVLKNHADTPVALIDGSSNVADKVELHIHSHDNGVMRMRQVEKIEISAHGETVLQPGGLHLMLLGLKEQLKPDQQIELELVFSDQSRQTLTVPVKRVMGGMKMQHDQPTKNEAHQHNQEHQHHKSDD
ncbi:copper chaperone PCu(A)C [Marinobacterium arenosum]|uniref:copper chaperone PCu(A)C n=1 Tax=Marinobacterium arenosum TaxID=2862496 RepID=UPI001C93D5FC|nr:copper chaperone PCu(A)C [Marinobacterium arenosum]MBY4677678.1 copper chaperone PCu(A)C [Marinobacterium arenosum]